MTTRLSCMVFSSGEWQQSHSLKHWRYSHCSWGVEGGVVLLGGYDSRDTSEVVTTHGDQGVPGPPLQHHTAWACSIADLVSETVVVTGGVETRKTVTRYGMVGFVEDLPSLEEGRYGHGCGAYLRYDGLTQVVSREGVTVLI